MKLRLTVTGPDAGSIRMAVRKLLEKQDSTATWSMEMETTPVFRTEGDGDVAQDWKCEVLAWDGRDDPPPPRLWAVDDEDDGV